ncbi:hypothetical protein PVAND_008797 [Polypedilum vanderplanki]|uniref:Uncharacterized protein n=1 Tax=Polypedilum vanderplanki TaxID=319348 RepID=A0A9J6CAS0_POLVA|nr:hypothetical protein PVAND_008797 [Polypedilum vanderplanki]
MSTIEERSEYLQNPFFTKHVYGDFTSFYITITVCTVFGIFLFALNLICGCCSRHKSYWNDRYTGNRWIVSLWTATAHKQPPLDLTELEDIEIEYPNSYPGEVERLETPKSTPKLKRAFQASSAPESQVFQYSAVQKPTRGTYQEEFVELQKRESEI